MLDDLQKKLTEQEDIQNKMYLHMYTKGQEAERINHSEQVSEIMIDLICFLIHIAIVF